MQTLSRAYRRRDGAGEPLPQVWHKLAAAGVRLRRGQLVMLASAPNSGKSLMALIMAVKMEVPTLYFSADTDKHDTVVRAGALLANQTMDEVDLGLEVASDFYEGLLSGLDHLQFCFDPAPCLADIDLEMRAYEEVHGQPPHLVVIDNLMNVQMDDADEIRGYRLILAALHHLARESKACVLVLHHVTGEYDGTEKPPPRRALMGKVSHFPEVVLTMAKAQSFIGVACVKNRNGPADPTGEQAIWLAADYARCLVTDEGTAWGYG